MNRRDSLPMLAGAATSERPAGRRLSRRASSGTLRWEQRNRVDVGAREFLPLKQQWQPAAPCKSVGKAVAIIEPGRMPALATAPPCNARDLGLILIDRNDLDRSAINQQNLARARPPRPSGSRSR